MINIKVCFEKVPRWTLRLLSIAIVSIVVAAMVLLYSFSCTVRSVIPDNFEVSSVTISDKISYLDVFTDEMWTQITDTKQVDSVVSYLMKIPLKEGSDGYAGGEKWCVVIAGADGIKYEFRFSDNSVLLVNGDWYEVKTTPFFKRRTDIYGNICQMAGILQ